MPQHGPFNGLLAIGECGCWPWCNCARYTNSSWPRPMAREKTIKSVGSVGRIATNASAWGAFDGLLAIGECGCWPTSNCARYNHYSSWPRRNSTRCNKYSTSWPWLNCTRNNNYDSWPGCGARGTTTIMVVDLSTVARDTTINLLAFAKSH